MRKKMWHCKSCGRVCDSSNTVCPDCGLDLGFYGEIQFIETGEPEPSPSSVSQPQEQVKPAAEEEHKPEIKEERKDKESKPKRKGKRGKVLITAGVVLLALLGLGGFMTMRRVDDIRLRSKSYILSDKFDTTKDLVLESGSRESIYAGVDVSGLWGPWPELTVTSSDNSVVNVSENFSTIQMDARKPGTAEITVRAGDKSVSYRVQVYQITGVEFTVSEGLEVEEGIVLGLENAAIYTARLQYTGEVGDEKSLPKVEVSSSDTDIVEVDSESGILIAKGYGTAEITASAGDYETSIPVNVYDVTGIEMNCYDLLVDGSGKTISWIPEGLTMGCTFTYYYYGPNVEGIPYTIESSNEEVISVDAGNLTMTAVGPGEATITAAMGGVSDSVTLEVYPVDRSTGAWVEGSIQTIATPAEDSSSKADYTVSVYFGDARYLNVSTYFGAGGKFSNTTGWEKVEGRDGVQAIEGTITLQGSKWEQKRSIAGITFLFKKASSESGDYNPATDLLDYWVVYTK